MVLIMYRYHLKDVEWREFFIGGDNGLFDVCGTITTHPSKLINEGTIPRITCAASNNGLDGFYKNEPTETGGVLTVDSATIGYVSYQSTDFIATDHVEKICNKDNSYINREIGLFIKSTIENSVNGKYGYGYKFSQTRIKRQKIMLPVDEIGSPNWHFMEEYIKERENKQRNDLKEYYKSRLLDLVVCPEILTDVEWGEFFVSDVFDTVQRGKRLTKANQIDGETPYISSTALNNGVDNFIGNTENIRKSDHDLTLANSGSVGACFYHNYEYIASDHVTSLKLPKGNDTVYKFISVILGRLEEKYSFNREINDTRIKREKLLLPIDKSGNTNWTYMENFIKNIEQKQIKHILKYLDTYIYI